MNAPVKNAPTVLVETIVGRLLADPGGYLRLVWSAQPRQLADTQAMFEAIGQALRQYGWSRVLSDQTQLLPFSLAEQQWISQEWMPGTGRASGYRLLAILVSSNVLSRLATAAVTTSLHGSQLRYRTFDDEKTAVAWLLSQPG